MKTSQSIANLAAALCKFQGLVKNPPKTKTATIPTNKGTYTYKYADLGVIRDSIAEPLAKCGLAWVQQPVEENGMTKGVKTIVFHESGEWIEFEPVYISAGPNASPQQVGSALTYARRYSLCLALGIVADEDDDAQAAETTSGNGSTPSGKPSNKGNTGNVKQFPKQQAAGPKGSAEPEPNPEQAENKQKKPESERIADAKKTIADRLKELGENNEDMAAFDAMNLMLYFADKAGRKDITLQDAIDAYNFAKEETSLESIRNLIYGDQAKEVTA